MEVIGRERLKIMTGTCDIEGRISYHYGAQDAAANVATGENGRNGAKEADSMALHSLCERRRGFPVVVVLVVAHHPR